MRMVDFAGSKVPSLICRDNPCMEFLRLLTHDATVARYSDTIVLV